MSTTNVDVNTLVLQKIRGAIENLASIGSATDERPPEEARRALAKALSLVLSAQRLQGETSEHVEQRLLIHHLLQLLDDRIDIASLRAAHDQPRQHRHHLHLCEPGQLSINLDVWSSGTPERQVDWWSICPLTGPNLFGALGTVLGNESDAAMIGAALCGALAVARKGLGNKLGPDRTHLILHTTLVDLFGTTLSVPTLAFRLNTSTGEFSMATAGHRSFWNIRRGVFQTLRARPGTPLGFEPAKRTPPFEMNLQPGDRLIALTAGVFEVESPTGDMLKESSLRTSLLKQLTTTPERTGASMIQEILERHAGHSNWLPQATAISMQLQ